LDDGEGRLSPFFSHDLTQPAGGAAMADHFEDDPAAQLRGEIKDEIYQDAGFSPAAQAAAMRAAAQLVEADRQAATDQQRLAG
jgi:hypothetical protein